MTKIVNYSYDLLYKASREATSISDLCRTLGIAPIGGNFKTIRRKIEFYQIDISHFKGQAWNKDRRYSKNTELSAFLQPDKVTKSSKLKSRLIEKGIKKAECEQCKLVEWLGKPIPLELHHIDGNRLNNVIDNLAVLCPNCHAQTPNHRAKNTGRYITEQSKLLNGEPEKKKSPRHTKICIDCGQQSTGLRCSPCDTQLRKSNKK